ncbi:LysR family transcriptional regulator [Actinacidiphila glaucinigra]|uniref:DNA-binding transcriptional regulator, LysR family n=1 Tax=Actinacidiphila glaucinigra TaxID=235986 RepID=A0A239ILY5_9ACTN|nr:LysR family transcriptional regulator [Actinacidiphila glaucinigra]SNS94402.1 DNA-binding transcriptional regulator, LysR family [Actinacidiphila glaucinigra]
MEFRRLQAFIAVAEERSFTRAAERLNLVQSGVSASIRALEKDLGTPLFARTTQRVELTAAGAALVPQARRVLGALRTARQAVDEARAGLSGTLELGILYGLTPGDILRTLATFRRAHPGVELRLRGPGSRGSSSHVEDLRKGDLDLAVLMTAGRPLDGLRLHSLVTESVVLACASDHPLADRSSVELADVMGYDVIDFPVGWGMRSAVDCAFSRAGLPPRKAMFEIDDIPTALDLVRHGLGLAFVPERIASDVADMRFLTVGQYRPTYDVCLAEPEDRPLNPTARAFLAEALGAARRGESTSATLEAASAGQARGAA